MLKTVLHSSALAIAALTVLSGTALAQSAQPGAQVMPAPPPPGPYHEIQLAPSRPVQTAPAAPRWAAPTTQMPWWMQPAAPVADPDQTAASAAAPKPAAQPQAPAGYGWGATPGRFPGYGVNQGVQGQVGFQARASGGTGAYGQSGAAAPAYPGYGVAPGYAPYPGYGAPVAVPYWGGPAYPAPAPWGYPAPPAYAPAYPGRAATGG